MKLLWKKIKNQNPMSSILLNKFIMKKNNNKRLIIFCFGFLCFVLVAQPIQKLDKKSRAGARHSVLRLHKEKKTFAGNGSDFIFP